MSKRRFFTCMLGLAMIFFVGQVPPGHGSETKGRASITRISPEEARSEVRDGEALLVCAYSDKKCENILLEGAMLRSAFEQRFSSLSRRQRIIFYCG